MFNSRKPSQFCPSDFEGQSTRELGKQQGVLQGVKGLREKRGGRSHAFARVAMERQAAFEESRRLSLPLPGPGLEAAQLG